jgi:hypothetical protein
VASRIGALTSYWTSAFHMAWGPMRRDPLHLAAERERSPQRVGAATATYFVGSTVWMLLALTLLADEVVHIAGPNYSAAAGLIPLTAAGFALHGLYVLIYRTQRFPEKRTWFIRLSQVGAAVFLVAAVLLIPPLDAYGAAAAVILAWIVPIVVLFVRGYVSDTRVAYDYGGVGRAVAAAAVPATLLLTVSPREPGLELTLDLAAVAAYPFLLLALRVVPTGAVSTIRQSGRSAARIPDDSEAAILYPLFGEGRTEGEVAARAGLSTEELRRRVVASLRRSVGAGPPGPHDERIGAWLLDRGAFAERDRLAQQLMQEGVEPLELDRLALALRGQRRIWRRRRTKARREG